MNNNCEEDKQWTNHSTCPKTNRFSENKDIPLNEARSGRAFRVTQIAGGQELRQRLADIGLGPGAVFTVEKNDSRGPLVVMAKGSRLLLGQGMIHKIRVVPCI